MIDAGSGTADAPGPNAAALTAIVDSNVRGGDKKLPVKPMPPPKEKNNGTARVASEDERPTVSVVGSPVMPDKIWNGKEAAPSAPTTPVELPNNPST